MGCGQYTAAYRYQRGRDDGCTLHTSAAYINDDEIDGGERAGWETSGIDEPILLGIWAPMSSVRTRDWAMSI